MSKAIKRVVVKVGTRTLTSGENALDKRAMEEIVRQLCELFARDIEAILVTSAAIASGMGLLGIKKRPLKLATLQAMAAIGQSHLMDIYSELFNARGRITAQMLLTQEDFNDRARYLNIKYTLNELLGHRTVPIINENDTVSTEEIRCGDNDRLSSLVADLADADMLIIVTDVDGLYGEDGKVVSVVEEVDEAVLKLVKASRCDVSRGGMATKLEAARRVTQAGIDCVVVNGRTKDAIVKAATAASGASGSAGTFFKARKSRHLARERWIAFSSRPKGALVVDAGAKDVLMKMNKSLLPSGIIGVEGKFDSKDTVSIVDRSLKEFARGIVNYSSEEVERIRGKKSQEISRTLGYKARDEVVHKDNLVIL